MAIWNIYYPSNEKSKQVLEMGRESIYYIPTSRYVEIFCLLIAGIYLELFSFKNRLQPILSR